MTSGSPAERAFRSRLAFLDADRPYPALFERLGITRLISGQTLDEEVSGADTAVEAPVLKASLVSDLGPYLLAIVIAKAEEQGHAERVRRRLHERFEVRVAADIELTFTLRSDSSQTESFRCPRFHVGFLDLGPEAAWPSAIICDPFGPLINRGTFDLDIVLEIRPKDLFGRELGSS